VVDEACAGLNGIELGEKKLVCQRANIGAKPHPNPDLGGLLGPDLLKMAGLGNLSAAAQGLPNIPGLQGLGAAGLHLQSAGVLAVPPTRIVVFQNIVRPEEVRQDQEYKDIIEDITQECTRFGTVKSVVIPRPRDPGVPVAGLGKVFVEFGAVGEAQQAESELRGRKFSGRVLLSRFFKESDFLQQNFDN